MARIGVFATLLLSSFSFLFVFGPECPNSTDFRWRVRVGCLAAEALLPAEPEGEAPSPSSSSSSSAVQPLLS